MIDKINQIFHAMWTIALWLGIIDMVGGLYIHSAQFATVGGILSIVSLIYYALKYVDKIEDENAYEKAMSYNPTTEEAKLAAKALQDILNTVM